MCNACFYLKIALAYLQSENLKKNQDINFLF